MDKILKDGIHNGLSAEQLSKQFKRKGLILKYEELFRFSPSSSKSKLDIAQEIINFYRDEERTKDLCKVLVHNI